MQRALELAASGLGRVSPNPQVGCVLVTKDGIIGEGFHHEYGGPHAEVEAINAVKDTDLLSDCTLYVNLEPCSHHGKTPPCADLIIESKIPRVVISNLDPNPKVSGEGVAKLKEAGVEVVTGILGALGAFLNRRFFTYHERQRPYIILKWAQTADGFMAKPNYDSKWISNRQSRQLVHIFRAQEDAILIGRGTAQYDDPQLTVRGFEGNDPLRIVLDPTMSLSNDLKLFDGSVPTLCYNYLQEGNEGNVTWIMLPKGGFLANIWQDLHQRGIQSVLAEGGAMLLQSMTEGDHWDEARVFVAPHLFGEGIKAPVLNTNCEEERLLGEDRLRIFYNQINHG